MEFIETFIKDCFEIENPFLEDQRGRLVKPYICESFAAKGLDFDIKEVYFSISQKNVLRGLHFQTPPKAMVKLVSCVQGKLFDVVVDLRKNSSTYLKYLSINLSAERGNMLFIPEGLAHGFCALSDNTTMLYMCSEIYSPENDSGIRWDSAGIQWPIEHPLISKKDNALVELSKFESPFN